MATVDGLAASLAPASGSDLHALARRLYPIARSITGEGLRRTLSILGEELPLDIVSVPSGTRVFDWTVPDEWRIRDAYVADSSGRRVIDYRRHNLHLVGYSVPVRATLSREELDKHLHSLPSQPDWIPYVTSYYSPSWGFCLTHRQREALAPGNYEVVIDSELRPGALDYGELALPGRSPEELLLFTHTCHPSLGNDNLSGIVVLATLARMLLPLERRRSYRFLFAPTTIGSITWLARNESRLKNIAGGLVVSVIGDRGPLRYKRTRHGDAEVDRVALHALGELAPDHQVSDFSPWGYDERQFSSPGIDLPVGRLTRTPNGAYPEYHTSADDLSLIDPDSLFRSACACARIVELWDANAPRINLSPKGEPQLGRRGLYRRSATEDISRQQLAILWVLNLSDGRHTLLDMVRRSGLGFDEIRTAALAVEDSGLIVSGPSARSEAT